MRQVDSLTVAVLVDNTTDMLSTRPPHVTSELRVLVAAGMRELSGERLCSAHHGLSLLVTARSGGQDRSVLFDAGPDPYALDRNGRHMGLDFGTVDAVVLSHGHFDHAEGLLKAAELVRERNGGRAVPLHLHPGVYARRAIRLASGGMIPFRDVPSASALSSAGYAIVESNGFEEILDGTFALSGEIPRTSFERGMGNQVCLTPSGDWQADPLVLDERFMIVHVKDKGLAVFTGCSHAGVVNICRHAQELFPSTPLYALIGGLHLVYPNEDLIEPTISELLGFGFKVIIPGHCTGWRAIHAFVRALGDAVVDPLAVGTRVSL